MNEIPPLVCSNLNKSQKSILSVFIWLQHLYRLQPSPDTSFTAAGAAVEEELQDLKNKLIQEETKNMELQQLLQTSKDILQEKESAHAEQVTQTGSQQTTHGPWKCSHKSPVNFMFFVFQLQKLQAVVCEKDVRFQEQIQKHEEELMKVTLQTQNDGELMEVKTWPCLYAFVFCVSVCM